MLALSLVGCSAETAERALSPDAATSQWGGSTNSGNSNSSNSEDVIAVPANFPAELGYEKAILLATSQPQASTASTSPQSSNQTWQLTRWRSAEPSQTVASFYTEVFQKPNWKLQPAQNEDGRTKLIAENQTRGLQVIVDIKGVLAPGSNDLVTDYTILYGPAGTTPPADIALSTPADRNSGNSEPNATATTNPNPNATGSPISSGSPANLPPDWSTIPAPLQTYVQDVYRLGGLATGSNTPFNPNQPVTRRTFARWLVLTNNRIFSTRPARQIRLATNSDTPVFRDVSTTDPDFAYIQGLAAAGYIPSPLSGNPTQMQFRPDTPLSRETLLQWKVPVDVRQNLPTATLDQVKQVWGFKDITRITPEALPAVMADYQNGDQANIRRLFGATLLLQPQKPVTRAEAAAALWYIGYQNDGLSAQDGLKALAPAPTTATSPTGSPINSSGSTTTSPMQMPGNSPRP
jgi:hypothetical protein